MLLPLWPGIFGVTLLASIQQLVQAVVWQAAQLLARLAEHSRCAGAHGVHSRGVPHLCANYNGRARWALPVAVPTGRAGNSLARVSAIICPVLGGKLMHIQIDLAMYTFGAIYLVGAFCAWTLNEPANSTPEQPAAIEYQQSVAIALDKV